MNDVSVVIPHVPIAPRAITLRRAVASVIDQSQPVSELHVAVDNGHDGPAVTRNRGLFASTSKWVLYLDDDDYLDGNCIEHLVQYANETDADVVYPWFRVDNGTDPFPGFFNKPWDDNEPHIFPVTYLVKTVIAKEAGGFPTREVLGDKWAQMWNGQEGGEDWYAILALMQLNAKIVHLPERLWTWEHGHHEHFSGSTW